MTHSQNRTPFAKRETGRIRRDNRRAAIARKQGALIDGLMKTALSACVVSLVAFTAPQAHATQISETSKWYAIAIESGLHEAQGPFDEHACYGQAVAHTETEGFRFRCFPACEYEDQDGCVWDANRVGNWNGISFYNTNGKTFYITINRDLMESVQ